MSKIVKFNETCKNSEFTDVEDVSPKEVFANRESLVLIDVRRPDEFTGELGHIPGSRLITLDFIPQQIHDLPKDSTIVFVCRSGRRSAQATSFAQEQGFESVYNMEGGMILWNELSFEVSTESEQ